MFEFNKRKKSIFALSKGSKIFSFLKFLILHKVTFNSSIFFLILFSPLCYSILSAETASAILGTQPYFTYDGGLTRTLSTEGLLGITLSDGSFIINSVNPAYPNAIVNKSTMIEPIELPAEEESFANIKTNIPEDTPESSDGELKQIVELNRFVNEPYNYWGDDDGDTNASATGTLSLEIEDFVGNKVKRSEVLDTCHAPYRFTLNASEGILSTSSGLPSMAKFPASSATYYIKPKRSNTAQICSIRANMNTSGQGSYNGPISEWDPITGFKLQNLDIPSNNFPTMGAYGLYFTLEMVNTTNPKLYYTKSSSKSGITLNIQPIPSEDGVHSIYFITLLGPDNDETAMEKKFVPTTFTIFLDKAKTKIIYRFTIKEWFVVRKAVATSYSEARSYCEGMGYRLPSIAELTNANGNGWLGGLDGQDNHYRRRISFFDQSRVTPTNPKGINGGLFSEWGNVHDSMYQVSFFTFENYWANEPLNINGEQNYPLISHNGSIHFVNGDNNQAGTVCVTR